MDFRKISNISVDCVILGFNSEDIHLLLDNRSLNLHDDKYPVIDDWVLTGDHLFKSERLDQSAKRIIKSTIGFDDIFFKQFRAFGNPERLKGSEDIIWMKSRDINLRTTSVVYYFLLPMDRVDHIGSNLCWHPIKKLPKLGFDHLEIVTKAFSELQERVLSEPLIFEFLEDKFTLNQLQSAFESVLEIKIDNRNFRKKIIGKSYIVQLDEKRKGESKKPASLYMFSRDIYSKTSKKRNIINI